MVAAHILSPPPSNDSSSAKGLPQTRGARGGEWPFQRHIVFQKHFWASLQRLITPRCKGASFAPPYLVWSPACRRTSTSPAPAASRAPGPPSAWQGSSSQKLDSWEFVARFAHRLDPSIYSRRLVRKDSTNSSNFNWNQNHILRFSFWDWFCHQVVDFRDCWALHLTMDQLQLSTVDSRYFRLMW